MSAKLKDSVNAKISPPELYSSTVLNLNVSGVDIKIHIAPIPVSAWLTFEEKKIEPDSAIANSASVGLVNAIRWLFPQYLKIDVDGEINNLTGDRLDEYEFESYHIINILSKIATIDGNINTIDRTDGDYLNSNDFVFLVADGRQYRITRDKIPWSDTPKFIKMQGGNRGEVNRMVMYSSMIEKYFKLNGEKITKDYMDDPSIFPLPVFLLIIQRLGKLITA